MKKDTHERFNISVSFTVCEGLQDKALEEVKDLLNYIKDTSKSLSHCSDLKTVVTHKPIEDDKGENNG
jgi:hypothetical protein